MRLYDENGQLYGFIKDNGNKYFYVKDILGTILGIVNEDGYIVAKYDYSAFGECTIKYNTSNIAEINPFRFKGYYYDNESGMYYCLTRYLVPEWGRWLNADSPNFLEFDNINGMNLFAYCGNDPVDYLDPTGHKWWHWLVGLSLVAVTTIAMVATAGLAAAAIGVSVATAQAMCVGAGIATAVAGTVNLASQASKDIEEFDLNSLMSDMLINGVFGMVTGGIGAAIGSFSPAISKGTKLLIQMGIQATANALLSTAAYIIQSSFTNSNLTLYGIGFAGFSGFVSGLCYQLSFVKSMVLSIGLTISGYLEEFIKMIKNL